MEIKTSFNLGDIYYKEVSGKIEKYYVYTIVYQTKRKYKNPREIASETSMKISFYKYDESSWCTESEEEALKIFYSNKAELKLKMMERLMEQ